MESGRLGLNKAIGESRFLDRLDLLGDLDIGLPNNHSDKAAGLGAGN